MRNLLVAAGLALAAAASPAVAATTTISDPIDAGPSRLDLKGVTTVTSATNVVMTLRTHRNWATSVLAKASPRTYACAYLWKPGANTKGNIDFQVCASSATGSLKASVYSVDDGDTVPTATTAARAGRNGLRFSIPRSLLGPGAKFSWFAGTRDGAGSTRDAAGPRSTALPQA